MYGTVARLRVKQGAEAQLAQQMRDFEALRIPGFIRTSVYQMDADPREFYLTVLFESKDAYWANAKSPDQDARYQQMVALLDGQPEWHDGEVVGGGS
ncbi:MAG TPA: antibiotic biosynthesis monooxygenase family protein [Ktedonobacterales bacterium]|nr:antibiotic biosynthesis monooxygenase family protein [Ktedonobacterales bacterium]